MAVKEATVGNDGRGVYIADWQDLAGGDTGEPVRFAYVPDKTVQAIGDGTAVIIEGSNDNLTWAQLTNPAGDLVSLDPTQGEMTLLRENPMFIRPNCTGGASTRVIVVGASDR